MYRYLYLALLISLIPIKVLAYEPLPTDNYWKCNAYDDDKRNWAATNIYQKVAMNVALAACKKESKLPASCKISTYICEEFNQEKSSKPRWRCTALDDQGNPWPGDYDANRDTAALNALSRCKGGSKLPLTCSINLVSCSYMMDGEPMQ